LVSPAVTFLPYQKILKHSDCQNGARIHDRLFREHDLSWGLLSSTSPEDLDPMSHPITIINYLYSQEVKSERKWKQLPSGLGTNSLSLPLRSLSDCNHFDSLARSSVLAFFHYYSCIVTCKYHIVLMNMNQRFVNLGGYAKNNFSE